MPAIRTLLMASLYVFLAGCAAGSTVAPFQVRGAVWPAPPNDQRIAFVGEFSRAADVGIRRSTWAKIVSFAAGTRENALIRPMAVAATQDHNIIFVADPDAHCVHRYDIAAGRYRCLASPSDQPFVSPIGLAVTEDGWLFVADSQLGRLFQAAPGSKELEPLDVTVDLEQPTGMYWDSVSQSLYVTDTRKQAVLVFDRLGQLKQTIGERGSAPGAFNFPTYLWKESNGDLLVADTLNFRLQRFDADGNFLLEFGENGDQPGNFARPKGVAADSKGHIYVVDALMHSLQIFSPRGEFLLAIGGQGQGQGRFWLPNGIFIAGDDMIFVADSYNKRVQVFRYVGPDL
jgi:sugar lactone lactonase YvrE